MKDFEFQYSASEVHEIHKRAFRRGLLCGIVSVFGVFFIGTIGYLIWIFWISYNLHFG